MRRSVRLDPGSLRGRSGRQGKDAPALGRADVGIAIGGGRDVAVQSAGIILVSDDALTVVKVTDLSKASYQLDHQD
jgi:Cu2+-exporting ATPase